ncbi:peptidase M23 [Fervidicella metallireducens AeB]|uniref:Peptidase M23 n=1 Tax=Fervidicella metallireducens AeB TaxID=1403537 RepID=A0A017RWQ8_9CLOT|nr:peptidase M23 [Fervidicella metallireducens AeB]
MLVSVVTIANADTVTKKKDELNETKKNISRIKNKIHEVKELKQNVVEEINRLENKIDKVTNEIETINNDIGKTKGLITTTNKELEEAINDFNNEKEVYGERLKTLYINGPTGYLDILAASESFSDFISRVELVKKIIEYDKGLLKEMKEKQEKIEYKKMQLENHKQYLVKLQNNSIEKKEELADANAEKKAYYQKLSKDQAALEKALDDELAESKRLEAEIKRLTQGNNQGSFSGSKTGILKVSDIGHMPPVTSPFGMRYHPVLHKYKLHTGIDFGVKTGTPIYAMSDGEVIISGNLKGYGYTVAIAHGGGITSLYAHCSKLLVSVGQKVKKGQLIAKSGNTGYSTGPHLHFEIRKDGTPVNPAPYVIIGK